jgi:hypothetical protein
MITPFIISDPARIRYCPSNALTLNPAHDWHAAD